MLNILDIALLKRLQMSSPQTRRALHILIAKTYVRNFGE